MKSFKIFLLVIFVSFLNSCQKEGESYDGGYSESVAEPSATVSDNIMNTADEESSEAPLSSTAATYQDPDREFVRTADLSMEVDNVYNSTTKIESKVSELGGFMTKSNLESRVWSNQTFAVTKDSAVEVKKYTVENQMTVRIPQKELGNFLNSLGEEMRFLNFRHISADDVSLEFVLAELEKDRMNSTHQKLEKLENQTGKIPEKQSVVTNSDHNRSDINFQKVSTMKLKDEVAYSSVSLLISEKEKIAQTMVINPKTYEDKFRPEFAYRAGNSIKEGFYFFQNLLIGLLYIWPIWVLGILVFLFVRYQIRKPKTVN